MDEDAARPERTERVDRPRRPHRSDRPRAAGRWLLPAALVALLVALGLPGAGTSGAVADSAPPVPTTPATVTADALPTVQVNGVVWSQVTVGNTVYATGSFTSARPAGSPAGTNETPRGNLLAYDITTGNLVTSFNHRMNAQGFFITASPDGSRVYVGGDFTAVDGVPHQHLAAFSTATGALLNGFTGGVDARVRGLAATSSQLFVGGSFTTANGSPRSRLAAFTADTGALLPWAPAASSNVHAVVVAPGGSRVVVGGKFTQLNGVAAYGMGAVDVTTGATVPWPVNQRVRDAGDHAAINSLRTDGRLVYGTGFVFGPGGNLEGTFAADPAGALVWVEDCHGDSYDTFVTGNVLYKASHAHYCGNIGAFRETSPRSWKWATAFTTYATQTITRDELGYPNWEGTPAPTQLVWYPAFESGSYTGQGQAGWSVTGNSSYVAFGGEFPRVNGKGQQGLVRFAVRAAAPNKVAPTSSSTLTPTATAPAAGQVRLTWRTTSDMDNEALTYRIVRDGRTGTPVHTTTVLSAFYRQPTVSFTDTGLAPGSTHTYRIFVSDPLGNVNSGSTITATAGSGTATSTYAGRVAADGASSHWRLGEASGGIGADSRGSEDLVLSSGVTRGAGGALLNDSDRASGFSGTSAGTGSTQTAAPGRSVFSVEAWFRTTSTAGGKIVGFGSSSSGTSGNYDRHLYVDSAGRVVFGVFPGGVRTLSSAASVADGQWHHVVGTLSPAGMVLHLDGRQVAAAATVTGAESYSGHWRVGGDNLAGWPGAPSSPWLAGTVDEVAVYPTALSATQVRDHYVASGRTAP